MAESTSLADPAPVSGDDLRRAEEFAREPFVLDGEDAAIALAPGTARRRALDAALAELDAGLETPSIEWRREYSLILGLERLLCRRGAQARRRHHALRPPGRRPVGHADRAHRRGPGRGRAQWRQRPRDARRPRSCPPARSRSRATRSSPTRRSRWTGTRRRRPRRRPPQTPSHGGPAATRRFWFEHATGAGKTVAALGFVEACRTGGVLILTHRRNLVDQFNGELCRPRLQEARAGPAARGPRQGPQRRGAGHRRDLPVVRAQRRQGLQRVHDRDLRRGPYRPRREDLAPRSASGRARSSSA